MGALARPT